MLQVSTYCNIFMYDLVIFDLGLKERVMTCAVCFSVLVQHASLDLGLEERVMTHAVCFLCQLMLVMSVQRASLDLGLKKQVMTHDVCFSCQFSIPVSTQDLKRTSLDTCSMFVLTHGTTRLLQIPSELLCFQWIQWIPSDYSLTLLLAKNLKMSLHFRFHLITRLPVT